MAKEERIGNPYKELVLRTSGTIKVLVGDKYYLLNYNKTEEEKNNKEESSNNNWLILAENGIEEYINGDIPYPGDNNIIFVPGDNIYYTINNEYIPFTISTDKEIQVTNTHIFNDTVLFNNEVPFIINGSSKLINNLNSQFLDGYSSSDFVKKSDSISFNTIKTSDELFSVSKGNLTTLNITTDKLNANILNIKNIIGSIPIGNVVAVNNISDLAVGKYVPYSSNIFSKLYSLYKKGEINTSETFINLSKSLLTIVNSSYNWENLDDSYLDQLVNSGIICKPYNLDLWKSIEIKEGGTLFTSILQNTYIENIDDKFNGILFTASITSGSTNIGDIITFELDDTLFNGIVTFTDESYFEFKSNYVNDSWITAEEVEEEVNILDNNGSTILSFINKKSSYLDNNKYYVTSVNSNSGIIGDLNNINDSVFGTLSGYGLYSSKNSTIINPNIALVDSDCYIKISPEETYLGKTNNHKWISIGKDYCSISSPGYEIDSLGFIKTNSFTVNPDGTITIGDTTGKLEVGPDGSIKLV